MSMNPFNKFLLIVVTVLAVGTGVAIAAGTNGGSSSDPATTVVDVKGPCDELEHATDPGCAGAQVPEDNQAEDQGDDKNNQDDDPAEAEDQNDDNGHGDDPAEVEDNDGDQGEDNDDQGEVEDQDDDNSGP